MRAEEVVLDAEAIEQSFSVEKSSLYEVNGRQRRLIPTMQSTAGRVLFYFFGEPSEEDRDGASSSSGQQHSLLQWMTSRRRRAGEGACVGVVAWLFYCTCGHLEWKSA